MFSGFIEHQMPLLQWQLLGTNKEPWSSATTGGFQKSDAMSRAEATGARLVVTCPENWADVKPGHSVCVNGVCLSVEDVGLSHCDMLTQNLFEASGTQRADKHELKPTNQKTNLNTLQFFLNPETLRITGWLQSSPQVFNLERSLKWGARLHGHLVTGHVEAVAVVEKIKTLEATTPDTYDPTDTQNQPHTHDRLDKNLKPHKTQSINHSRVVTLSYPPHLSPFVFSKCSVALNGVSMTVNTVHQNTLTVCVVPETLKRTNLGTLQVGDPVMIETDHTHRISLNSNPGLNKTARHTTTQAHFTKPSSVQVRAASTLGPSVVKKTTLKLHSTQDLVTDVRRGHMVILVDDEGRENEGDLVMPADFITPEAVNFIVTYARGLMCLALTAEHIKKLQLPPMVPADQNATPHKTAFTVSIEAATGIDTGISAADRARTVWVASRPVAKATDVISPGHVFPLQAHPGGLVARQGHTEASVELMRLAGLTPAAVICEVMNTDGTMARLPDLLTFGARYGIKVGSIENLRADQKRGARTGRQIGCRKGP